MEERPVRFGALSLLLLVVAICLAVLGMLSYSTAHASEVLAKRSADHAQAVAATEASGQQWLAGIDSMLEQAAGSADPDAYIQAHLPSGAAYSGGVISTEVAGDGGQTLSISVKLDDGYRYRITQWQMTTAWTEDTSIGGTLWSGQ